MVVSFTDLLTDIGNGLGAFLTAISEPVIYFLIFLGVGAVVVSVIQAIANRINSGMSNK